MPEGPELRIASNFINRVAQGRLFRGRVEKSEVSTKNPHVPWDADAYVIRAESRGKEMKLLLREQPNDSKKLETPREISLIVRFGMSGCFKFTPLNNLPKHAHLRFTTWNDQSEEAEVLSFVDYRRFGHWEVTSEWGKDRGPCPMFEYESFRKNVIEHLECPAFRNKPICEVLLNQKFFNGIGNYLRAEILFRAKIPPFAEASSALMAWKDAPFYPIKNEDQCEESEDPLYLTHIVPKEVLEFGDEKAGYNVDRGACDMVDSTFDRWLRCYQNSSMKNLVDNKKRTIWFGGEPGPLLPKGSKSRKGTPSKRTAAEAVALEHVEIRKLELDEADSGSQTKKVRRREAKTKKFSVKDEETEASVRAPEPQTRKATASKHTARVKRPSAIKEEPTVVDEADETGKSVRRYRTRSASRINQ